jgi:hypothetical protein
MKYIKLFKNKFFQKQQIILLGRWNIVYCEQKINKKVELANEDHCGNCNIYKYNNYNEINIDKFIFYETI